jgi:hypothetical protein
MGKRSGGQSLVFTLLGTTQLPNLGLPIHKANFIAQTRSISLSPLPGTYFDALSTTDPNIYLRIVSGKHFIPSIITSSATQTTHPVMLI